MALSEHDVIEMLSRYDLGTYIDCTPFTSGTVQTNLSVQTTAAACVLRYYERGRTIGSIHFEINLLRYLKSKQYPCPMPFRNTHGHYVDIYKTKPYAVFEFMEGHHAQHPNESQKQQLIQKAAELHTITKKYRPTYKNERWNYGIALCQTLAEKEAAKIGTTNAMAKLAWHQQALAQLDLPASLPKGICHADFHFSNVLFKDNTFAALLDFDDANYTFLLFDLVGLIEAWAWPYENDSLNFAEAKKVLSEYSKYRPLHTIEKRHLFDVYKLSILIDCVWYFGRGDVSDFYEKQKIDYLNRIGNERFYHELFGKG